MDQKNAESTLLHIRDLFKYGQVNVRRNTQGVYRYSNNSFKGLIPVRDYFLTFSLKTKKAESFKHWLEVFTMVLNKKHLVREGPDKIRAIAKIINIKNNKLSMIYINIIKFVTINYIHKLNFYCPICLKIFSIF